MRGPRRVFPEKITIQPNIQTPNISQTSAEADVQANSVLLENGTTQTWKHNRSVVENKKEISASKITSQNENDLKMVLENATQEQSDRASDSAKVFKKNQSSKFTQSLSTTYYNCDFDQLIMTENWEKVAKNGGEARHFF